MQLAKVFIHFKDGVLDPQGTAVKASLLNSGYEAIKDLRAGKLFEIKLDTDNKSDAEALVKQICEKLLVNPVIEDYEFEILEA